MLRVVQSDKLSFKRQDIDLLVMPCLFHATCSLWTSLAGTVKILSQIDLAVSGPVLF